MCVATGDIKRRAIAVTQGWDDETTDIHFTRMTEETLRRVRQDNLACGDWCGDREKVNVWVDASCLAIGVLLEEDGTLMEDAYLLRPVNGSANINLVVVLKRCQLGARVEGHEAASAERLAMRVSMDIR